MFSWDFRGDAYERNNESLKKEEFILLEFFNENSGSPAKPLTKILSHSLHSSVFPPFETINKNHAKKLFSFELKMYYFDLLFHLFDFIYTEALLCEENALC